MNLKKLLTAWTMALILVGGNLASVWAGSGGPVSAPSSELDVTEYVCAASECVDVYKVKCGGPTRAIFGYIQDNDSSDDNFILTLTGLAPGPIKGHAVSAITPNGGFGSADATFLVRQGTSIGAMQAYATVSTATFAYGGAYFTSLLCIDSFFSPTPTTVTFIQDQD